MTPELFSKTTTAGGRNIYRRYVPTTDVDIFIDDLQINTLVSTIAVCWLSSIQAQLQQIKKGSALATRIRAVEESITKMAQLVSGKCDDKIYDAGTKAWTAALVTLQQELAQ